MSATHTNTGIYDAPERYPCQPKDIRSGVTSSGIRAMFGLFLPWDKNTQVLGYLIRIAQDLGTWKAVSGQVLVTAAISGLDQISTDDMACAHIQHLVDQGHIKRHWMDQGQTPAYCPSEGCVEKLLAYARSMPSD